MKKSELKQIIKEEIVKILQEGGPMDALGSAFGAFQTQKTTTTPTIPRKKEESFVITNGQEWYAGSKNYLQFAKHNSQSNLYPTHSSAQKALFNEIPDDVVKSKQLKVQRYN
jgi:hypothetical protein